MNGERGQEVSEFDVREKEKETAPMEGQANFCRHLSLRHPAAEAQPGPATSSCRPADVVINQSRRRSVQTPG